MQKNKTQFALKLSREKIQLLLLTNRGIQEEIGSTDPNKPNIVDGLKTLLSQLNALTGNRPIIDVMLPDELILIQNLTVEKPLLPKDANKIISEICQVDENEIKVAVGLHEGNRTQRVAAITTKTLDETKEFLTRAGFLTHRFMGATSLKGFNGVPIFTEEKISKIVIFPFSKALTTYGLAFLLLLSLTAISLNHFDLSSKLTEKNDLQVLNRKMPILGPNNLLEDEKYPTVPLAIDNNPEISIYKELEIYGNRQPTESATKQGSSRKPRLTKLQDTFITESNSKKFRITPRLANLSSRTTTKAQENIDKFGNISSRRNIDRLNFDLSPNVSIYKLKSSIKTFTTEPENLTIGMSDRIRTVQKFDLLINQEKVGSNSEIPVEILASYNPRVLKSLSTSRLKDANAMASSGFDKSSSPSISSFNVSTLNASYPSIPNTFDAEELFWQNHELSPFLKSDTYVFSKQELIASEKYRPVTRPNLIAKINVLLEPTLSSGAITLSLSPIARPEPVAVLTQLSPQDIKIRARATKRPTFPNRASVANHATISDIIELNRTNLIGIFGTNANAVALIRLASGQIIKVKVGDRFEGWRVLSIYKDKVELANEKKQETLRLPG